MSERQEELKEEEVAEEGLESEGKVVTVTEEEFPGFLNFQIPPHRPWDAFQLII